MKYFLKNKPLTFGLLLFVIATCFTFYSCRKDSMHGGMAESEEALATHGVNLKVIQQKYNNSIAQNLKTSSVTPDQLKNIVGSIDVDWSTFVLYNNADSSQTIEFSVPDDHSLLLPGRAVDTARYRSKTSAVFILKSDTVNAAFFMKTVENGTTPGYVSTLTDFHYKHIPAGFSGNVLYFTLGRNFINGYAFVGGSISKALSVSAIVGSQQVNSTRPVKTDTYMYVNCTEETWDIYYTTIFEGVVTHRDYAYSITFTYCDLADDGGGGSFPPGGGVTGDGGVNPNLPPLCPPAPAVAAVKGKIIINLMPGGGGGSGGGGGGGTTPCVVPQPPAPPTTATVTNNIKNACLKSMVNSTISAGVSNQINTLIQNVFGSSTKMNLTFEESSTLIAEADGFTVPPPPMVNGALDVTVQLDVNHLPSYSQEYIARVIMHEALHAYMFANSINLNVQHEDMAINYVTKMGAALQQMFPGLSSQDAKNLSLGGLQLTTEFKNKIASDMGLLGSFEAINLAYAIGGSGTRCNN
ncbi:hypothetical protein DYU05_13350 [Mucilaginibacter terrenus]|uniref:Uncharacterized protein n=1 Tax=Mucilaginibacter terrenus TaxID=2482727 RepID=A0A3E2NQ46_9SPHI|nr:hypothetical protein [Mucilaginibacter terrenus]RFZ83128.1 hypothetical protein DYU05_13350 [Mucilaginibacter terrenus]